MIAYRHPKIYAKCCKPMLPLGTKRHQTTPTSEMCAESVSHTEVPIIAHSQTTTSKYVVASRKVEIPNSNEL